MKKADVVKVIAAVDVFMALFSFALLLTILYMMGDSVVATKLVAKDPRVKVSEKEGLKLLPEVMFRWVFIGIIIIFALIIHAVQILMAWVLYRGANMMKDEQRSALKAFGRWRAWSIILLVFMLTGAITLIFVFGHLHARWSLIFLFFEILFQISAIIYIGQCAKGINDGIPHPSTDLNLLYNL